MIPLLFSVIVALQYNCPSKHINTHNDFIRELVNDGQISLFFFVSKEQLAHMFTKPLETFTFVYQREHLGIDRVEDVLPVEIKGCLEECNLTCS